VKTSKLKGAGHCPLKSR